MPGRSPMPGRYLGGVTQRPDTSTPRFLHGPSNVSWVTAAMLDFPDRGAPFSTTIQPGDPVPATAPVSLSHNFGMDVAAKLQIKPGQRIATIAAPDDVAPIAGEGTHPAGTPDDADVVVAFVRTRAELTMVAAPALEAARRDRLAWIAYPKAGKLGTDLNRDILASSVTGEGVQPVRQIAIDEVWSALRFRPDNS